MRNRWGIGFVGIAVTLLCASARAARVPTPAEIEAIAKEATIYGYPMVMNYKTMFAYSIDQANAEYKAPFNQIHSEARVYTPNDKVVVTPNSDTPYSMLWADLRAEPLVLGVPEVEPSRYYSLQFIDLYTFNFAYAGSRTTGTGAAKLLLAGPGWKGTPPDGIAKVIRSDTDFVLVAYRTQLLSPSDIDKVKEIQAGYTAQPLSAFTQTTPPAGPAMPSFPPFTAEKFTTLDFFGYLNFLLTYCPAVPEDAAARARFAQIGIAPGKPFVPGKLPDATVRALEAGMAAGLKAIDDGTATMKSASTLFGTREFMQNDSLRRAMGAKLGIYGNSKEEAAYFRFKGDQDGKPLDGAAHRYEVRFAKDALPPVSAFWSVTMYDGRTQLLVENPIGRYLINSTMLSTLKRDDDGGFTIYVQKDSPGKKKEANWLPAPNGPIFMVLRAYAPQEPILSGTWKAPQAMRVD